MSKIHQLAGYGYFLHSGRDLISLVEVYTRFNVLGKSIYEI